MKRSQPLLTAFTTLLLLLLIGTVAYRNLEGWSWVDSFYFTGTTLATIGYGDLNPTHDLSKIFTVIFAFGGIATFFYVLGAMATEAYRRETTILGRLKRRVFGR